MKLLDLSVHDRDDYEGKVIECNGSRYVVGDLLGVGAERVVHRLINERSTLSLFVIKILKQPRPRGMYTQQIAVLRTSPKLAGVIPVTLEVDVPGGMVELQRNVASSEYGDRAAERVRQGFAALGETNPSPTSAQKHFAEALQINPLHSEALYGMAHALWRANEPFRALAMIEDAVEIEPHALHYRRTIIDLALATQQYGLATYQYRVATRLFENVHDLDELGTEIFLDVGNPEQAKHCVVRAMVDQQRRVELEKTIDEAINARTHARMLMHRARASVMAKNWAAASSELLQAQAVYNRDPELCMNTAFATLHEGDARVCAGLMLHASMIVSEPLAAVCAANAGFGMLKADELENALGILDMAALRISSLHGGEIPATEVDLPSVGVWIEGDNLIEERITAAADLISRGLHEASASQIDVPDRVRQLAAAYRTAAAAAQ